MTVKIDGIAASAASIIAMAGTQVLVSPVSMLMIHNPATMAFGDHAETWMNANMAIELGFADGFIERSAGKKSEEDDRSDEETEEDNDSDDDDSDEEEDKDKDKSDKTSSFLFSRTAVNRALQNKLEKHYHKPETIGGTQASDLRNRLDIIKKYI